MQIFSDVSEQYKAEAENIIRKTIGKKVKKERKWTKFKINNKNAIDRLVNSYCNNRLSGENQDDATITLLIDVSSAIAKSDLRF